MPTRRIFPGWWITLAFAAMVFISTGLRLTVGPLAMAPMAGGR